jgi:DNA-binding NtrC family response regulator
LLKVLEEHRFRRVGDVRDKQVDIRLIAATHQDLTALAQQQRFRSDLFFRISTIPLAVPPLRRRPQDIPALAHHLLERCGREMGRTGVSLSPEALDALREYSWPGNIRELRNVLERALLVSDGAAIRSEDLRFAGPGLAVSTPFGREETLVLSDLERTAIEAALAAENGNVERAARRLGISRSALYKKIKRSEGR